MLSDERMAMLEVPVLVAGAGPAGLTVAIELARRGVESLVVDRRTGLSPLARATGIGIRPGGSLVVRPDGVPA